MSDYLPPYEQSPPEEQSNQPTSKTPTIAFAKDHVIVETGKYESESFDNSNPSANTSLTAWIQKKPWQQHPTVKRKSVVILFITLAVIGLIIAITVILAVTFSRPEAHHTESHQINHEQEQFIQRYYDHHYF